ncbi:MAG: PstS family phosphate ABC transporter substrate-binding protein [Planctomycetota bacterium]|jgi:phosphate transport system substrate-binding protein
MNKTLMTVGALAALVAFGPSCTRKDRAQAVQIKGSDTMVNLGSAWTEAFKKVHPDIPVAVTGGGSGTGISAMIDGHCDIAQASRVMKDKEKRKAKENGREVKEIIVGSDCVVVAINPNNVVQKLTLPQLSQIFTGQVTNWKDLGGKDAPITVVSRERNSGTHVFFLERVVRKGNAKGPEEYAADVIMAPSSQAVFEEVKKNPNAIGYYGLGYLKEGNKAAAIKDNGDFVTPSVASVANGTYAVARPLYMYTAGEPTGNVKVFVDFVLSPEGQKLVAAEDFVPLNTVAN